MSLNQVDGSVHGRFQPFHLGHLEYALAAWERCDYLWVGITQPEIGNLQRGGSQPEHRFREADNPFSYWVRSSLVEAALVEAGLRRDRFRIVPFPIERPAALSEFIPTSVVAFTTIYEKWNEDKILLLEQQGYRVEVLWRRLEKAYSGGKVRQLLSAGDPAWRELVPPAVASGIDTLELGPGKAQAELGR